MAKTTTAKPVAKKAVPTPPTTKPDKNRMKSHELVLSPTIQNAVGIQAWGKFAGEAALGELIKDLHGRVEKVQAGDMKSVEAMLYGQAMSLQTIFTSLSRRATSQEYLTQFQAYLGMALKAQAQCRATLEALAEIKNPRPVLITRQANISGGHQQVNNGTAPPTPGGAEMSAPVEGGNHAVSHAQNFSPLATNSNAAALVAVTGSSAVRARGQIKTL